MLYINRQLYTLETDVAASIIPFNGEVILYNELDTEINHEGKKEKLYTIKMSVFNDEITLGGYKTMMEADAVMEKLRNAIIHGDALFVMPEPQGW